MRSATTHAANVSEYSLYSDIAFLVRTGTVNVASTNWSNRLHVKRMLKIVPGLDMRYSKISQNVSGASDKSIRSVGSVRWEKADDRSYT